MKTKHLTTAILATLLCIAASATATARIPTPRAVAPALDREDEAHILVVIAEPSPDPNARLGFAAYCEKANQRAIVRFSFGAFPPGKNLQAAVRLPDGSVHRFGPVIRSPGPSHGYHDPEFGDPETVRFLFSVLFTTGVLVSNGHNSVWNELPEQQNADIVRRLTACAFPG